MTRLFPVIACFVLLFLCFPHPAAAGPVNCGDPTYTAACAAIVNFSVAGGPNPYVYAQDANPSNDGTHYLDLSNPDQINYSCPSSACAGVSELASGSLSTGILQISGEAVSVYDDFDSVGIGANDIFTLGGPSGSVGITATFTVTGTAYLAAVGAGQSILIDGGDASIELCGPGGSFACGGDTFQATGSAPYFGGTEPVTSEYSGEPYLLVTETWMQQTGVPFDIFYSMTLGAYSGSAIDLTDPGTLSFTLPSGYSLTSEGGFSQGLSSSVPEPGTFVLLLAGLGAVVWADRRTRRARGLR